MSFYTNKTDVTSILKTFSGVKRNQANAVAINKVRFSTPKEKGLAESVRVALEERNFHLVKEFTYFLREAELSDDEVVIIIKDAKRIVHNLTPEFVTVVEALLSLNWKKRSSEIIEAYTEFCIELMVTHNRYLPIGVSKLIVHWIPGDMDESDWVHGCPSEHARNELKPIHKVLDRILTAVPMAFDIIIDAISAKFPYFKKPYHVTAGYLYNVLWLLEYKPIFEELVFQLVLQKILLLDVNAPKDEIELEMNDEEEKVEADTLFEIDDVFAENVSKSEKSVSHPVGKTLDVCLFLLYKFFDGKCRLNENSSEQQRRTANRLFKMLLYLFDEVLLPSHNTHHVQFILFYATSLRSVYSEAFLDSLWTKVQNPNVSAVIRHAAVGYMASFLSRARFLPLSTVIFYLKELTKWAHAYIDDSDAYKQNCSLKANLVFYSVCQAVFYLIAFRARDLTASSKACNELHNGYRAKFLTIVYWIAATYVLADVYSAQLTSQFARPAREPPINTLQRLQAAMIHDGYRLYVEKESSSLEMLENGTELFRQLYALMRQQVIKDPQGFFIDSVEAGIKLIAEGGEDKAVLGGRETLFFNVQQYGSSNFQLSQKLYTRYSAVAVQIGCPFLGSLNNVLMQLFESGILDKMTAAEYAKQYQEVEATRIYKGSVQAKNSEAYSRTESYDSTVISPLNLRMLQGAFIALGVGALAAGLILLLEIVFIKLDQARLWMLCSQLQWIRHDR